MLQNKHLQKKFIVTHKDFLWTSPDGQQLYAQCWNAGNDSSGGILLVHGMGEHSSRYEDWAGMLAENGFSVLSFDLRGHGKTPGIPGSASNYYKILNDIDLLISNGVTLFKDKPVFLYGHSFGGNLVANYVISRKTDLAGVILTSPWFELAEKLPKMKIFGAKILNLFLPFKKVSSGIEGEYISKELKEVHKYRTDPLNHGKITVRLYMQTAEHGRFAKRSIYKINIPLLIIHGSGDKITSCKASREFVMNSSNKTTYIEIDGGYHELHNDSDREKVFEYILNWLNKQVAK